MSIFYFISCFLKNRCFYCGGEGSYYGSAPHYHKNVKNGKGSFIGSTVFYPKEDWPDNFEIDKESNDTAGIYYCTECKGTGKRK